MPHPHWPLFDLEISTPRLTMRYIDDDSATRLATLAAEGIHDPEFMPFGMPWTRHESPELERQALQYYWRCRVETSPQSWLVNFAVIVDGEVVGSSGLMAEDYPTMRQFETGSWLGRAYQGRGIGTEMRIATLAVGFLGLDAEWATTGAWHDNGPSLGVTTKLGYTPRGQRRMLRDGDHSDVMHTFEMSRAHFDEHLRRDDIELHGIDAVRAQLAISD